MPPSPEGGAAGGRDGRRGAARAPGRLVLVTGTDTGVGKTTVAGLLLADLRRRGVDAAYWKPVETGVTPDAPQDEATVRRIAGAEAPVQTTLTYPEPLAPAVAAARAGRPVGRPLLDSVAAELAGRHELVLVEGAGGLLVELAPGLTFRELARDWGASVVLVVGNRLGCLNHAALTLAALQHAGLPLAGWVLNDLGGAQDAATATNLETLQRLAGAPLAHVPWPAPAQMGFAALA